MSVVVDRKKPASYNGKSPNCAPIRSMAASKGSRDTQAQGDFSGIGSSGFVAAPVNRSGVAGAEEKMNRKAVERVDSHVVELLSTVPQVVLYQYEEWSNTWVSLIMTGRWEGIFSLHKSSTQGFPGVLLDMYI